MPVTELLFGLIRYEICGAALPDGINTLTDETLAELYEIAEKQDIAHLTADALIKNGLIDKNSEIGQKFYRSLVLSVYRYENINAALNDLCAFLEQQKIPFIPLKGAVIRKYYPEEWMRTSTDIDVLVHAEDLEKTLDVLQQNGYTLKCRTSHDVTLNAKNGVHIELHFRLLENFYLENSNHILENPWKFAAPHNGCVFRADLTDEMVYFYHIAHMAKHLVNGGCGIRFFIDTFLLNRENCNREKREKLLADGALSVFEQTVTHLTDVWFGGAPHSALSADLENWILSAGIFGDIDNYVAIRRNDSSKFKYVFSRLFLPYNKLKLYYPRLEKYPFLLPFYHIARIIRHIKNGRLKYSSNELKKSLNDNQNSSPALLLKKLGLK